MIKDNGVRYSGTRHPDWPVDEKKIFPEQQINKHANKIVDKHYQQNKNKSPFTQVAENAVKELSFTMRDGHIENNEGTTRLKTIKEGIEMNEALDKNFQDQKNDDYIKQLEHWGIEESSKKHPGYPKISNPPILAGNINNRPHNTKKNNPTINRYKEFKDNKKRQLEEKKFNENYEKEYGDKAIQNYVRSKVNENRKKGKADYEDLPSSYLIVGEAAKDEAKKKLKEIKIPEINSTLPDYLSYKENLEPVKEMPSLEQWMAARTPKEIDPAGITTLNQVKHFKNTADFADQKFPKRSRGIGPFLTGKDDE